MNLLVTGGAGFIGANFIFYMQKNHPDYHIVCLDALTYAGNLETLELARKSPLFRFVKGDITDRKRVFGLFEEEKFDAVVNFAAESHVDRSIENPGVFLTTNVFGTQVLLDACRAFRVSRFHQISTDEVYGDLPLDRPDLAFDENSPIRPSSPYSASKASADLLALAYFRTYRLPVTVSRCSNNFGPYQLPEKLIPLAVIKADQGERIPVYGDGKNVRDWLYVEDHCAAIDSILQRGNPGEVYNIGGNSERSNLEVILCILKEMNQSETLISFVPDRPGHDLRYAINAGKIRKELGWMPETAFEEGLKKTVRWYLENRNWWGKTLAQVQPRR